jgi:uracil permease
MIKIVPILIGVIASYVTAIALGAVDFSSVASAPWLGFPIQKEMTVFALLENCDVSLLITSVITIMPIALATIVEHIGDISAISSTTGINYIKEPGLHRTLLGDGLATAIAGLLGSVPNTTYGENTSLLAITKNYDHKLLRRTSIIAIALSFIGIFGAVLQSVPA